ncbi:unnamed protein product [Arabis nemorensis]|uniref:Uncharacterized protein n=1 Tax=Arabis nemorensis TaxID=586526 RepID=A0A565C7V6_9BRAS|nr:unnamed protein product [Arabis nemorensis]
MPLRRAMRDGLQSEVVDQSGSEDFFNDVAGAMMEDSNSSKEIGQFGCMNRVALQSEFEKSDELMFPPMHLRLTGYRGCK